MLPIISINPKIARELDISIGLRGLYYNPSGYYRTSKKLYEASLKDGFDFSIYEICDWLERQVIYQIHKPCPQFIHYASFNNITIPMEVIKLIFYICHMTK